MSYKTITQSAYDSALTGRLTACIAQEGYPNPEEVLSTIRWSVISHSDIEAAYASALAANNPDPGGDESVITDGMILSAVQEELTELNPTR